MSETIVFFNIPVGEGSCIWWSHIKAQCYFFIFSVFCYVPYTFHICRRSRSGATFEDFNQLHTFKCMVIDFKFSWMYSNQLLLLFALSSLDAFCFHIICVVVLSPYHMTRQAWPQTFFPFSLLALQCFSVFSMQTHRLTSPVTPTEDVILCLHNDTKGGWWKLQNANFCTICSVNFVNFDFFT